ncbi:hypothetical protein LSTR_LSTR007047 [Laodelphax striatellus]|uniref:Uncharacterized protein n=1 Tax=Laodelphax striatellus TaxID=195883 RepID=A0A482WJG0_LAOST|nr:hypothetical protein LSTR_LSTR007047 [Laodelphax striatellus]
MDSSSEESIAMEHGVQDGQDQGFRPPTPPPMPHPPPHAPELAGPLIVALPAIEPERLAEDVARAQVSWPWVAGGPVCSVAGAAVAADGSAVLQSLSLNVVEA